MKSEIEMSIDVLVGLPLWSLGRAANMAWFEFGARRTVTGFRGDTKEVGDYALHVQCAWRIIQGDRIVVASRDIYCMPEEIDEPILEDFDWQKGNRFDRIAEELFQNESREFMVQGVCAGSAGSLTVLLEDGYALEVFPNDSESREHWRFLGPYVDKPHLVFSGKGLAME
jgi:hypothetical protein